MPAMIWCLKAYKFTGKDSCLFCPFCLLCSLLQQWCELGPAGWASRQSCFCSLEGKRFRGAPAEISHLCLWPLIFFQAGLATSQNRIRESPKEAGRDKQGLLKAQPGADTSPFNTSYWVKEVTTVGKGRKTDRIFKGKDCRELWNSLN